MNRLPAEVDRETPASLWAAWQGFKHFHGIKDAGGVSDDEFLAILAEEQRAGRA
jgi:hypothetical protein